MLVAGFFGKLKLWGRVVRGVVGHSKTLDSFQKEEGTDLGVTEGEVMTHLEELSGRAHPGFRYFPTKLVP